MRTMKIMAKIMTKISETMMTNYGSIGSMSSGPLLRTLPTAFPTGRGTRRELAHLVGLGELRVEPVVEQRRPLVGRVG